MFDKQVKDHANIKLRFASRGPLRIKKLQGDQRQGKSGNFKSSFSNQGKSGKKGLFGENQGISL